MSHRSRLGTLVIDCRGDDLAEAMRFWSAALGSAVRLDPDDPRYAAIDRPDDEPQLLLQAVEHSSRVHLDLETDDREAEGARLEAPRRARSSSAIRKGWIIMEAPTGHRFCLVAPQRPTSPATRGSIPRWPTAAASPASSSTAGPTTSPAPPPSGARSSATARRASRRAST